MPALSPNPFTDFFQDPFYLELKNHLYNYLLRRRSVRKELSTLSNPEPVLEIGSGVSTMTDGGKGVIFSDITLEAVQNLKSRKIAPRALVMSVTDIAFQSATIPTVICSEVIEHVKEDEKALREMYRVLKSGGTLLLTVPVNPRYYAFDDFYVKHERRYHAGTLLGKLQEIGFKNLRFVKVTGFLDKIAMILLTAGHAACSNLKNKKEKERANPLLKALLPVYKIFNWVYAGIVSLEAKIMPLSTTAVLLIRGTKP